MTCLSLIWYKFFICVMFKSKNLVLLWCSNVFGWKLILLNGLASNDLMITNFGFLIPWLKVHSQDQTSSTESAIVPETAKASAKGFLHYLNNLCTKWTWQLLSYGRTLTLDAMVDVYRHTNKQTNERTNEWMDARLLSPHATKTSPIFAIFDHAVNIYLLSGKTFSLF